MQFEEDKFKQNWQEAQRSIANFLKNNSFMVWEERKIENRRVDVLAKRTYKNKIFYLVFEVKHYEKITPSIENKSLEQLEDYLKLLFNRELERKAKKTLLENYLFVGYLVLSKDYGIYLNRKKNWRKKQHFSEDEIINEIWRRNVFLFCSSQEHIQSNLESIGFVFYSQSKLSDFFKSGIQKK